MKEKLKWWQIASLCLDLMGAVFITLCIATNIADDIFLPLALASILCANVLNLVMNHKNKDK